MPWFKVDDGLFSDPDLDRLDLPERDKFAALGLWVVAGSYCARHLKLRGVITEMTVFRLTSMRKSYVKKILFALVRAGLWEQIDSQTFKFKSWEEHYPSEEESERRREKNRNKVRKHRESKKSAKNVTGLHEGYGNQGGEDVTGLHEGYGNRLVPDPYRSNSDPDISNEISKTRAGARDRQAVSDVFFFWAEMFDKDPSKVKMTRERTRAISARLAEGYSVGDLEEAIRGAASDPWMLEHRHTDVATVLKSASSVDRHRDRLNSASQPVVGPAPPSRPEEHKEHDIEELLSGSIRPQDEIDKRR